MVMRSGALVLPSLGRHPSDDHWEFCHFFQNCPFRVSENLLFYGESLWRSLRHGEVFCRDDEQVSTPFLGNFKDSAGSLLMDEMNSRQ